MSMIAAIIEKVLGFVVLILCIWCACSAAYELYIRLT